MTNARFDDKNLSVRFTKIKLDIYKPTINLVQSSADQGGSKITIPIPQKYIYYTYNVMLPLIDLEPISSPLIIILLLWLTLFAFHKYINYSSPPKAFLDYIFNCAYLLSIYQLNNNNNSAGNDNNNKCTVQNKTAQIICDDINVNTIYRFTSTRECGITLDEIWKVGLIIIWCIYDGHLGYLEIDNKLRAKYNIAVEGHHMNIMTEISNKYYRLYIENDGNNYLKEIYSVYNSRKISLKLYNLLHKMLNRNPTNHQCNDMILIHGECANFHSALLNNNYNHYAFNIQQNQLNNNKILSLDYNMSQSPMNSTELLKDSTPYILLKLLTDFIHSSNSQNRNVYDNMYYKPQSINYFASMNCVFPVEFPHNEISQFIPTNVPTFIPTNRLSIAIIITNTPTQIPTNEPTLIPTVTATNERTLSDDRINPSLIPTIELAFMPPNMTDYIQYLTINSNITSYTHLPTTQPTIQPTKSSKYPSNIPTINPTLEPTINPIYEPSNEPTTNPSEYPSITPMIQPTNIPSTQPTIYPTLEPTINPTNIPSQPPTWAPFTPSPSLINDDPFIIEIDIIINCESQMDIKIYPPTVNTIVYELLKPKYEKTPNLWVKSIVKQSNNKCETIIINSKYTTDIISYAIQINHYVNTTLSDDILIELNKLFNTNINSNNININIKFNFITKTSKYPTINNNQNTNTEIIIEETYNEYVDSNKNINSFNSWLYGENNLNWIIILIVCCLLFPFCCGIIWYCNRYQTQTLLRKHKKEIQKFQTLSASTSMAASPDRIKYTTTYKHYRPNNNNNNNDRNNNGTDSDSSDDDDIIMDDGDGYTHNISPIHKQNEYKHITNKSDCFDGRQHLNDIINNYNQMRSEYSNNNNIIFNHDGNTTTDEIDGSMTDYNSNNNIINRMRNNTNTTATTISNYTNNESNNNNSNIYNDSDRIDYDIIDDYKQHNNENKLNNMKHNEDYLVVKGMGLTPSLVPLKSDGSNDDIGIAIQKRNNKLENNINQFDDYKMSADKNGILFENDQQEVSDNDTDNGGAGDEFQAANSNVFSPPNSVKKLPKSNTNNNNIKYSEHTHGQSISIVELPPINNYTQSMRQSDILKENSNDRQYEDGTATRTGSNTINTINSEEQHHENIFDVFILYVLSYDFTEVYTHITQKLCFNKECISNDLCVVSMILWTKKGIIHWTNFHNAILRYDPTWTDSVCSKLSCESREILFDMYRIKIELVFKINI